MNTFQYCHSLTKYRRLTTQKVMIGNVPLGSRYPVRIQSMTNTNTGDTSSTVAQIKRIADAGADYVRMTTRTISEAKNIQNIKTALREQGYDIPLIADVHFNPKIAETAAVIVDKVRINPGNYAIKKNSEKEFSHIKKNFIKLIELCKTYDTAIRIGVNHGSLSQRIMDKYGNTPEGMVQSAIEFLQICEEQDFNQVVVSLKSSNTRVMVHANRLLTHYMLKKNRVYPLHLGVTEAGEGEDGRIKSSIGIGSLLVDGIGDTIRISLTEEPEKEIPVAKKLINHLRQIKSHETIPQIRKSPINPFKYEVRNKKSVAFAQSTNHPVISTIDDKTDPKEYSNLGDLEPEFILKTVSNPKKTGKLKSQLIIRHDFWLKSKEDNSFPYFHSITQFSNTRKKSKTANFIFVSTDDFDELEQLKNKKTVVLILQSISSNPAAEQRRFIFELIKKNLKLPVIIHGNYREDNPEDLQIKASADLGLQFIDGLAEGILIENRGNIHLKNILSTSFGILQASRTRIYKTEIISCPGCGRTQFNLEETSRKVRQRLSHLKGLKIAVMGCIVNGPGEMADADYGYVGSGRGKVTLYKGKEIIKKNIPENKALDELITIIQNNGDWLER